MSKSNCVYMFAISVLSIGSAFAAVSAEEAKQLGTTLTAWGAEKTGNKDGTIPAYTGEPIKVPANYDPKHPMQHPDPFNDKPLFTITAQNTTQYADKLTEGLKAVFKTYPNFRMDIYPTHRTAIFPKTVLDNTLKNATSCKAVDNGLRLEGCYAGFPFPIPKTGNEAIWNHLLTYEGQQNWYGTVSNWLVPPSGAPVLQSITTCWENVPYYNLERTGVNGAKDIFWRVRCDDLSPARRIGQKLVIHDALDQLNVGRRAWQYIPGQRRVKLAPDLSYDTPNPFTGGASTMDDAKIFMGALDRYEWKLMGKQEKYILINSYSHMDSKVCPDAKFHATKNFPNPDCMHWELHRVWVVDGKLKQGYRHIYARRTLYWDEDGFLTGQAEAYDAGGKLFRVILPINLTLYEAKATATLGGTINLDLQTGIWASNGYGGCGPDCGWTTDTPHGDGFYSPEALAGEGIR